MIVLEAVILFSTWLIRPNRLILVRHEIAIVRLLITISAQSGLHLLDNRMIGAAAGTLGGVDTIKLPVADLWEVREIAAATR